MKTFYLDTEFNGFLGRMISMALVSEDLNTEFYEVLPEDTYSTTYPAVGCDPWVMQNVIPVLNKEPISVKTFQDKLQHFLVSNATESGIKIVADWPEDLTHFTKMLIKNLGQSINTPIIHLTLNQSLREYTTQSKIPHNALEDARAIARGVQSKYRYYD